MKNILFLLFILLATSCSKEDKYEDTNPPLNGGDNIEEQIFKATGCKPTDCNSISKYKLFTDKNNIKYLYGSKNTNDQECFWFAQYNSDGNKLGKL